MRTLPIDVPSERLAGFCRDNRIRKLSLFGSVLREDFRPTSDLDVLVEFEPGHSPGLKFFSIQDELSTILGRRVDLHTANDLRRYFRDQVLQEAEPIFVDLNIG